jgi:hypothetical protein
MRLRNFASGLFLLILGVMLVGTVPQAVAEEANTHEGLVVSAGAGRLSMMGMDGKQQSFDIGDMVKVTVNGHMGKLEDLKTGARIRVTIDKAGHALNVATVDTTKGNFSTLSTD